MNTIHSMISNAYFVSLRIVEAPTIEDFDKTLAVAMSDAGESGDNASWCSHLCLSVTRAVLMRMRSEKEVVTVPEDQTSFEEKLCVLESLTTAVETLGEKVKQIKTLVEEVKQIQIELKPLVKRQNELKGRKEYAETKITPRGGRRQTKTALKARTGYDTDASTATTFVPMFEKFKKSFEKKVVNLVRECVSEKVNAAVVQFNERFTELDTARRNMEQVLQTEGMMQKPYVPDHPDDCKCPLCTTHIKGCSCMWCDELPNFALSEVPSLADVEENALEWIKYVDNGVQDKMARALKYAANREKVHMDKRKANDGAKSFPTTKRTKTGFSGW